MEASSIRKIAIFRALQLGDMLCAIPAIRMLRKHFPQATISLVSLPWAEQLVTRFPQYFDELIIFPGFPGLPEQPLDVERILQFMQYMSKQQFDFVLQMQGNGSVVNPMVTLWNGKSTGGFYRKEDYYPGNLFLLYPETVHEIERHLLLIQHVCTTLENEFSSFIHHNSKQTIFTAKDTHLEFPLTAKDYEDLAELQLPLLPKQYVCIHPGSRGSWRQWPPEYFARLADRCAEAGLQVVLTGTTSEASLTQAVKSCMKYGAIDLTGKTSLGAIGALLQNAFALIANCTGVSHITSALETPSVIISMDGEPHRWAPLNKQMHLTIDWTKTPDIQLAEDALEELLRRRQ